MFVLMKIREKFFTIASALGALAIFCHACGRPVEKSVAVDKNIVDAVALEDCFRMESCITLKEDESAPMRGISKLVCRNNMIYVSDGRGIFVFDENGLFKQSLRNQGRGPGEYLRISDFSVGDDAVYIMDSNRKILEYDANGKFVKDADLDDYYASMYLYCDKLYLVSANQNPGNKIHRWDAASLQEETAFCDIPDADLKYRHFMGAISFFEAKDGLLFHESLNNVVSRVEDDSLLPFCRFDFYGSSAPDSFWSESFMDVMDVFGRLKQNGYSAGLPYFAMDHGTMLYHFSAPDGRRLMGIWSDEGKRQFQFDAFALPGGDIVPLDQIGKFFYGYDDMYLVLERENSFELMKVRLR